MDRPSLPYVPFATFCTALDYLKSHGTPDRINSSVFPTFSGGVASHVRMAMRFLGAIDAGGKPQAVLAHLVDDRTRKAALAKLIPQAYASLFQRVDLSKASPSTLDEALRAHHLRGATVRKAKAFLIKAALFAGIPVSNHLTKRSRGPKSTSVPGKTKHEAKAAQSLQIDGVALCSKTLKLPRANGTLVLSADVDLFSLRGEERELVYKLTDLMNDFEVKRKTGANKAVARQTGT